MFITANFLILIVIQVRKFLTEGSAKKRKNFLEFMRRKAPQGAFTTNLHHPWLLLCV
jgi:hypothetical protein